MLSCKCLSTNLSFAFRIEKYMAEWDWFARVGWWTISLYCILYTRIIGYFHDENISLAILPMYTVLYSHCAPLQAYKVIHLSKFRFWKIQTKKKGTLPYLVRTYKRIRKITQLYSTEILNAKVYCAACRKCWKHDYVCTIAGNLKSNIHACWNLLEADPVSFRCNIP